MAVEWKDSHKRASEYKFYPEQLIIKPELNGRTDLPNIDHIVADIVKRGQSTPVTIRNENNRPVLVAGFSRFRAISYINEHNLLGVKIPVRCSFMKLTEAESIIVNIQENACRNPTTALDDANNIKRLINVLQMSEEEVITLYKPTAKTPEELKEARKWLKERLALLDLTKEATEAVRDGRVKPNATQALAKLTTEQQKSAVANGATITRKDVVRAKPKTVSEASVTKPDPELLRRVNKLLEDVTGIIDSPEYVEEKYVEVEIKLIQDIREYIDGLKRK